MTGCRKPAKVSKAGDGPTGRAWERARRNRMRGRSSLFSIDSTNNQAVRDLESPDLSSYHADSIQGRVLIIWGRSGARRLGGMAIDACFRVP